MVGSDFGGGSHPYHQQVLLGVELNPTPHSETFGFQSLRDFYITSRSETLVVHVPMKSLFKASCVNSALQVVQYMNPTLCFPGN
jgi:hypothetical protein